MTFASANELKTAIFGTEPGVFVSRHLFESVPHAFSGDLERWIDWKTRLGRHLEVDPAEMVLTGSSAVGFSMNPSKNYAAFHPGSDIDVGVISAHHFEIAWRYLRRSRPGWLLLPPETRRALKWHRNNYVFSGAIATDMILSLLPFGQAWQTGLDDMATQHPTLDHEVRLRIYRDYDALRTYQVGCVEKLRRALLETVEDETEISTEE
jgi:hypothetical protein